MHEFSLVLNIIDIVTEYAVKENARDVREVEIEGGDLSGVVIEAMAASHMMQPHLPA